MKNNWKEKKIDELGYISRGRSRHRPRNDKSLYGGKYPFVQTGDVKAAEFYISIYSQTYNEKGLAQSKLWDTGTLCLTIAANIAESGILKIKACFPDSIIGFIPDKKESDVRFVKYLIDDMKRGMQAISAGAAQDNLSVEKLLTLKFLVPNIEEQKKIADVLSVYDDLIENNSRRIKILEDLAQSIYNEWFVKFHFPGHEKVKLIESNTDFGKIPEGWVVKKVSDCLDFVRGTEPGSKNYENKQGTDNIPFLRVGDLGSRNSNIFVKTEMLGDKILNQDDIVMSFDGTVGLVDFGLFGGYSTGLRKVKSIDKRLPKLFVYNLLSSEKIQNMVRDHAKGTTIKHAGSSIDYMYFIRPEDEVLNEYERMSNCVFEEILSLDNRNNNLRRTRDFLLPKLIKGEVEVK
jgi:type I restriction enzyme S subunit